jgi:outer membrane murein-binding lipoprotein Lpp
MKRKFGAILTLFLISSMLLSSCSATVPQQEYDAMKAKRDALVTERDGKVAELNAAQKEIDDLQKERDSALAQVEDLQDEQDAAGERLDELQDEYNVAQAQITSLRNEMDTAQAQIASLQDQRDTILAEIAELQAQRDLDQAQIESLQEQIGTPTTSVLVEEAWDAAVERYLTIRENIDFNLEGLASWVRLPEKPTWFDSARICSIVLADEPGAYESLCIITLPEKNIFMSLSEYDGITTAVCRGTSQEYLLTVTRGADGKIAEVKMLSGKSLSTLSWTEVGGDKFFEASVDEDTYEVPWSDDATEFESICAGFVSWLGTIEKTGGLIAASDQPMMFLGMGGLHASLRIPILADWRIITSRILVDIMHGVPSSGWW